MEAKDNITGNMSSSQLTNELHRAKKNEKQLMDKNKELKRQLSVLLTAENSLKKEQLEVAKLKKKASEQNLHVDKLRTDLEKTKTDLRNEETQRAHEKTIAEQKILDLQKKCQSLKDKYSLEKTLREQKEKETEVVSRIRKENKKLTLQLQTANHQVQELAGYKNFASKKIEEQAELLKKRDMECEQTTVELNKVRDNRKYYKDEFEKLIPCVDRLQCVQAEAEERKTEIKTLQKQVNAYKKKNQQLKKEISGLKGTNESTKYFMMKLEDERDKAKEENKSKKLQLEDQAKEAEKQRNIIMALEKKINKYKEQKRKEQDLKKEETRQEWAIQNDMIDLKNLICELESMQRLQILQNMSVKAERNLISENLFKAQAEIIEKDKIIKKNYFDIKDSHCKVNQTMAELVKYKRKYHCTKNQLERVSKQLTKVKMMNEEFAASAGKDRVLAEKEVAKVTAEQTRLYKELACYKELKIQQQQKIDLQSAEILSRENIIKEHTEKIKSLQLLNSKLEHNYYNIVMKLSWHLGVSNYKSRKDKTKEALRMLHPCLQMAHKQNRKNQAILRRQQLELEKKDEELEELKRKLALRPDDTIQKYHELRWDNRELKKQVMALKGRSVFEDLYKSQKEEIKQLTDELRGLKLELKEISRPSPLPPIGNKSKTPTEDKSQDQSESGFITRHTRFPLRPAQSHCPSEKTVKTEEASIPLVMGTRFKSPLPPISTDTRSTRGVKPEGKK